MIWIKTHFAESGNQRESIADYELSVKPPTEVWSSGAWTCYTGGGWKRCRELLVGVVVASQVTVLVEERLLQGFLF